MAALVVALAPGCAFRLRPGSPLVAVRPEALPPLVDDLDVRSFAAAVERTLPAWNRTGDTALANAARALAAESDPAARRRLVAQLFRVMRVRDPILLTAYYEPELPARKTRDATFRYPIYARPPDLVELDAATLDPSCACNRVAGRLQGRRVIAYPSRAEIDAGALAGRGLELAWTNDALALFGLHIQGSGRLRMGDGKVLGVRYAGTNGRPYRSLARMLVDRGVLAKGHATMPEIRRYLEAHADQQAALLATNERYTFFRIADGDPIGSLGVPLTAGRSIATDPRLVPPGTIAYLKTPTYGRFVVSQDAGAAITGAHADLFLGFGKAAEEQAGRTSERGTLYLLTVAGPDGVTRTAARAASRRRVGLSTAPHAS